MRPLISLIAAVARNGVIGLKGDMPWHISSDLKYFRRVTTGRPIIMGRRTFESIGRALPGRTNIVVSRQPKFAADNVIVTRTLTEAIELAGEAISTSPTSEPAEIMVIGGGQLYNEAISDADKLYLTRVDADPDGDTWFPEIDPARFELISREDIPPSEKDTASCQFEVYRRRASMGN